MNLESKAGQQELERRVKMLLLEVGVSPNEMGYYYLADAIHIVIESEEAGKGANARSIMELYEDVAALESFNTKPLRVERCIRYAIERAFNRRYAALEAIFKGIENEKSGKVTNGCFINTLAQHLLIQEN